MFFLIYRCLSTVQRWNVYTLHILDNHSMCTVVLLSQYSGAHVVHGAYILQSLRTKYFRITLYLFFVLEEFGRERTHFPQRKRLLIISSYDVISLKRVTYSQGVIMVQQMANTSIKDQSQTLLTVPKIVLSFSNLQPTQAQFQ